jgi:hypothetical protein
MDDTTQRQGDVHSVAQEYVRVDGEIKALKARISELNKEKDRLTDLVLSAMVDAGAPSVEILTDEGRAKVYPTMRLYAGRDVEAASVDSLAEKLTEAGLGWLVKPAVNANTLSAWVREFAEENGLKESGGRAIREALPGDLGKVVKVSTTPQLAVRRSKS